LEPQRRDAQVIVETTFRLVEGPWTRRIEIVPEVLGVQVILYEVPTEIDVGSVDIVNGFWAAAMTAKALAMTAVKKRISKI
jgi:hypothetical protein